MSAFDFTDEELEAARKRMAARQSQPTISEPTPAGAGIDDLLVRLGALREANDRDKQALACYPHAEAGDIGTAARTCRTVDAFEGCRFRQWREFCALEREVAEWRGAADRLRAGNVPHLLAERVIAAARTLDPLEPTEAMRAARAFACAPSAAGARMDSGNTIAFTGSEWLLVLIGPPGCGKSIAAAHVIASCGGLWMAARSLANPKTEIDAAERASLLVLDDLGTEYSGASQYGVERAAALLELRHAERRRTVVTTNLGAADIVARYGERVRDRMRERGRAVLLTGPSLRGVE